MNAKEKEQKLKDYPGVIKGDNSAITALNKAVLTLPKVAQNNIKEITNLGNVLGTLDQTKEFNKNFVQLYSDIRRGLDQITQEQGNKAEKQKVFGSMADEMIKLNIKDNEEVQAKGEANLGPQYLKRDVDRCKRQKKLFQEFIFNEMREHARILEIYSGLFELTQNKINLEQEFVDTIISEGRFNQKEAIEYVQTRPGYLRPIQNQMRNAIGGNIQQQRSLSQQPRGMQGTPDHSIKSSDTPSQQQRGRSEAPPQIGQRH